MFATNNEMKKVLEADSRVTDQEKEAYAEYVRNKVLRSLEKADNGGPVYTHEEIVKYFEVKYFEKWFGNDSLD